MLQSGTFEPADPDTQTESTFDTPVPFASWRLCERINPDRTSQPQEATTLTALNFERESLAGLGYGEGVSTNLEMEYTIPQINNPASINAIPQPIHHRQPRRKRLPAG